MNTNAIAILTSFIGVCGTLFGTILGWVLNSLSNKGKILFSDIETDKKYMGLKENMTTGYIDNQDKATSYYFIVSLNSYNSSNDIIAIKNIKIEFYNDNKLITTVIPNDDNTLRQNGVMHISDKANIYNIHPKTIINFKFSCSFHKNITEIINANKINLTYQNKNGKTKAIKLV